MQPSSKPRLGVLALMLEGYEPLFPGITESQETYVHSVLEDLRDAADFTFPHAAKNRAEIEALVSQYNAGPFDGILILLLSYSQGQYLVHAMQENHLPLALALIQPQQTATPAFGEWDLTVNQGIHGSQDNANALLRAGIPCQFFAGNRLGEAFPKFVADFAAAARTQQAMRRMKISIIGKLPGMGDVVTDDMAVFRKLGPEFFYDSIGTLQRYCDEVTPEAIQARMEAERTLFEIDPAMPAARHKEAVRMYFGIRQYLIDGGFAGYTAHFDEFGADGRFTQLPFLAASNLMAEGFGYAAEGDATAAMWMACMISLCGEANFSEMYMMDFARKAILLCHAGEGNWKTCRHDRKPFLMDRVFLEGGLSNPPTPIFCPEPGKAAVMSLAYLGGERFRLLFAKGEVLDDSSLASCDMPYLFFRPASGVETCVTKWLSLGGTHHEVIVLGDFEARIRLLCSLLGIEFCAL